jgi:hypothetical protein
MTTRDRTVIVVILVVAAIVVSWLEVVAPKRSEASKLASEVAAAQSKVATARAGVAQEEAARSSFSRSYTEIARLGEAVPADDDVPSMLYQVQAAATKAHVDFRSLSLQPQTASSTPAPTTTTTTSSSSSKLKSSTATTAASTAATSATTLSSLPPGAAVGPAGFPTENFSLVFQGNFFHLSGFLQRLEALVRVTNRSVLVSGRLITLNAISLEPAAGGFPAMEATVSATTYIVPAAQGLTAGATPAGPSSSGTSSVSGNANPSTVAPATVTP